MAVYYWGTGGKMVAQIQERLKKLGYYPKEVDGIFGAFTYYALTAFQADNSLEPNGIAENTVLSRLGIPTIQAGKKELYAIADFIRRRGEGEPYAGQVAIGAVIINRAADSRFPDEISEVIKEFENNKTKEVVAISEKIYINASMDAINGWDPSGGALWFGRKNELPKGIIKKRIGGLVFG